VFGTPVVRRGLTAVLIALLLLLLGRRILRH
jgi:hypothetical protein